MYVAKMSGCAAAYTIFTPDLGELAFLADKEAPHPFYTRGFIFHMENQVERLIRMAYEGNNAAEYLFVKGKKDHICRNGDALETISDPSVPELEAIGGTGDTATGTIAATLASGMPVEEALSLSSKANRLAGKLAEPTPATQIGEIIDRLPDALDELQKE
jgi:NAD(P)H-hydrate repair Nnr-like enzyme with NAD(P)H-hydrate dehydratase domain